MLNRSTRSVAVAAALAVALTLAGASPADAQPRRRAMAGQGAAASADGADPAELTRLFDAYIVMQAQEALGLDEARFGPFVTRLKALQDVRRRNLRERAVLMRDMRQLLQASGNEGPLTEKIAALDRIQAQGRADEEKARAAIDDLLDVRQRARFRLLEQQLELRKLELVNRARQRIRTERQP